jgi:CRP-like cAMP-binding protein
MGPVFTNPEINPCYCGFIFIFISGNSCQLSSRCAPGFENHAIVDQKSFAGRDVTEGFRPAAAEARARRLALHVVLEKPNQSIEYVYFIESGLASEIAVNGDRERIEIAHVGSEGMVGKAVVLGLDRTPNETFIQVEGTALRLRTDELSRAMDERPSIRRVLLRYVHTCLIQVAHAALANGRYNIRERLARWLLTCHDRLGRDELPLTHEFLSLMLGVRRSGVTQAVHLLEVEEAIKVRRGQIVVSDRRKLERIAGGSYGVPEAEYERVIARVEHEDVRLPAPLTRRRSRPIQLDDLEA